MGYSFTDLSGWWEEYFGRNEIDFTQRDNLKQTTNENFYNQLSYNFASDSPVISEGSEYVVTYDYSITATDYTYDHYYEVNPDFPNGEIRIGVKLKGTYIGYRVKIKYGYYYSDYWTQYHRVLADAFICTTAVSSEFDTFFRLDFDELSGTYYTYDYINRIQAYAQPSLRGEQAPHRLTLTRIDFSQCFIMKNQRYYTSGACSMPIIYYRTTASDEELMLRFGGSYNYDIHANAIMSARKFFDWTQPDPLPFVVDKKGRYEGLPQSNIPLRQFIPTGIDYRHNITVYDETDQNTRNMFLTNLVGTIPYTLIDYRVPRGTLRVATDLQFTHFICCSFTSDNEPRVYRVTSYHVLGDNLIEYDFEMDGLKDYFQHFGITTSNNFLVERCTVKNTWNKLLNDTAFYDGTFTDHVIEGTSVYPYYAMNTPSGVFVLSEGEYRNFCRWVTEDVAQYSQAIVGQISSVHIVPYTSSNNVYITHSGGLTFALADGEPVTFTPSTGVMYKFYEEAVVGNRYDRYIEGSIPSCVEIVETFREIFDSNATIHIPFYGDFQPSLDILTRLSESALNFRYYISPVDGTCSVSFYPYVDVLPVVQLPTRTLPVNGTVSAMYSINREQALSTGQNVASTGVSMFGSALSGNIGGFVSSLLGGETKQVLIDKTAEYSKQTIKERQSVTSVTGSGGGAIVCKVAYISFQVPNLSIEMDDIFSSTGYPVQKLFTQIGAVSGNRYWLQMLGKVKGAQWYADLVTADIERDFIVYNY